jgi:crotonobetainyl-CoA:carnitine CoA-transferase CaiB-like acyl-CoA transferase
LTPGGTRSMALRGELAALIAGQPLAHWVARFEAVDACVTPVLRLDESVSHPVFSPEE